MLAGLRGGRESTPGDHVGATALALLMYIGQMSLGNKSPELSGDDIRTQSCVFLAGLRGGGAGHPHVALRRALPARRHFLRPGTLHPAPYTLHHTPYTLHPTPYTLNFNTQLPSPAPYTPIPCILHPTPYTLPRTLRSPPGHDHETPIPKP